MNDQTTMTAVKEPPFWLKDNFAPTFEEVSETQLQVTGSIPPELNGRYLRTGPNPQSGQSDHWFLGDGMIHGVELNDGKANWYRNRYVETPQYVDKDDDFMAAVFDLKKSLANTHIVSHAGKILALEELHLPYEMSPDLETIGAYDFDGKLKTGMTAHPKICPKTGEMLFFAYGVMPPFLTYHRVSAEGELVQSEQIEVKGATMMHDFNITENYVIFMDLPAVFDMNNPGMPYCWSDDYGARLGVMPRDGSSKDVVWYEIDPCYVYHPLNSYEDGDEIILDVCRSESTMKADSLDEPSHLTRWTINQKTGTVTEKRISDHIVEFPRVPDSLIGQKHRYGYVGQLRKDGISVEGLRKYDMETKTSTAHMFGEGRLGGEPVFVPALDGSAEDDGYLLCYVYDATTNKSEMIILDASDVEKDPIASIKLPVRVPAGFHGSWVPDRTTSP